MTKELWVRVKNVYGKDAIYPADPTAVLFTRLINQKTFTPRDLTLIEQLGYEVKQAFDPMNVTIKYNKQNPVT